MERTSSLSAVRLPLRLAAEPYAKQLSDSSVALGLHCSTSTDVELAMLVDDDGIRAFSSSRLVDRSLLLSLILGDAMTTEGHSESIQAWKNGPLWLLLRSLEGSNVMQWHCYGKGQEGAVPMRFPNFANATPGVHDVVCARLVTDSIRRYYTQQILEPSVRGFLGVLEKQFARADLYLFELLQNAVDDGASMVRFTIRGNSLGVSHDGRRFNPLDVLGLSSVGLSTKSQRGKRTIGFMGVGFKSVYKRYARVCIEDGTYSFVYQEPTPHKGGYGWVMLPTWNQNHQTSQGSMCQFSLERPRGGMQSVLRDLSVLPVTAPPLLGRAALAKMEGDALKDGKWTLDWNGKVHFVRRTCIRNFTADDASEVVTVNIISDLDQSQQLQERQSKWLFVSHKFQPSQSARESYQEHTKRAHSGLEEVCGFINLAIQQPKAGRVHSVLPTKICLPFPMHVHGSWLLSVDRQEVQDLSDNAWNLEILKTLPCVLANIFRWASSERLEDYKALMPLLPTPSGQYQEFAEILGQNVCLQGLKNCLFTEPVLPVAVVPDVDSMDADCDKRNDFSSSIVTDYFEGEKSVWVPPSFLKWIKPDIIKAWLGKRPLRTDIMGDASYHPFLASRRVICQLDPLPDCRTQLCKELLGRQRQPDVLSMLRMMAAIGTAYEEHPRQRKSNEQEGVSQACPPFPSSTRSWPVFLTENETMVTVDRISLPAEDFASVPEDLVDLVIPYLTKKEEQHGVKLPIGENFGRNKKRAKWNRKNDRGQPRTKPKPKLQRLHPMLEQAIISVDKGEATCPFEEQLFGAALLFLRRARDEFPANIVDLPSAVNNLLESCYKQQRSTLSKETISAIMQITQYAMATDKPQLLCFVLVDDFRDKSGMRLIPASGAYTGKSLDLIGLGSDLERFAGNDLPYLSQQYDSIIRGSPVKREKLLKLFCLAGVRSGLSISISAVLDIEKDRTVLSEKVLPKLSGSKLPRLRTSHPKSEITLPYGLGQVMNRRKCSLIDSELPPEWECLVDSMFPESAVGFISLLLALPVEDNGSVSATSVPAASKCLLGQGDTATKKENCIVDDSGNCLSIRIANDTAVPLRCRLYFLPPGQAGASALDISESYFVEQLKRLKWLPCATAISQSEFTPLTLKRPEEALLEPDLLLPEMPVVQLPENILHRLKSSPIARTLTWGTKAPPPPVAELVELTKEASCIDSLIFGDHRYQQTASVASRLLSVWKDIARAYLRGDITASHMKTIRSLSDLYIPARRVLESRGNDCWIVPVDRCVRMPDAPNHAQKSRSELKYLTISSLVASNFMCDFNLLVHNPFFSQPDISEAIINLAGIQTVPDFQSEAIIRTSGAFVQYCCQVEPVISPRFSPLRGSFSYAMHWCIQSPSVLRFEGGLKVWARHGPGIGSNALRRRWVPTKNGSVQVVLDDSRVRSELLTPDMNIQRLGVLNHTEHEKDCPDALILSQIDKESIEYFGIMRLSDRRFTVKTRARGVGVNVEGASSKIQLVCALLKSMELDQSPLSEDGVELHSKSKNDCLDPSWEAPQVIRHSSLSRDFRAPGMDAPSLTPMYAVFGRAPMTNKKCILVCGTPEDYSVELEDLVVSISVGNQCAGDIMKSRTKHYRAAMRLLLHLENHASFRKFLERDFADFDVTHKWQQLLECREIMAELEAAKKVKDVSALSRLLMTAKESGVSDIDGGPALLQSARDLLSMLKEEAEARRIEVRNNVLKQLKEAENARDAKRLRSALIHAEEVFEDDSDGGDAVLQSARELLALLEIEVRKLDEDRAKVRTSAKSCGQGRGASRTLPSWMTSGEGPTLAIPTTNSALEGKKSSITMASNGYRDIGNPTVPQKQNEIPVKNGKDAMPDLPESMPYSLSPPPGKDPWGNEPRPLDSLYGEEIGENSKHPKDASRNSSASHVTPLTGNGRGRGFSIPAWMTQTIHGSRSVTNGLPNVKGGRGRGISNLPSWMAKNDNVVGQTSTSKRGHSMSPSLECADEGQPTKKACKEYVTSEYAIRISIDSEYESEFIDWVKKNIQEKAKSYGGSADLMPHVNK